jgi:hypothetical protein
MKLLKAIVALSFLANVASAATPQDVQNQINNAPWTANRGAAVTGSSMFTLLSGIVSLFQLYATNDSPHLTGSPTINGRPIVGFALPVNNNTDLTALNASSVPTGFSILRQGFANAGDSPATTYLPSNSTCSLNFGAGDGGSQVRSADSKCWIASFPSEVDARVFGYVADGTTSNTAALAAIFALPTPHTIVIPPGIGRLPCGQSFTAASSLSLVGTGTIRLDPGCTLGANLFTWDGKNNVRVVGPTIDLNTPKPNYRGFWNSSTNYAIGDQVQVNVDGLPGNSSYYVATVGGINHTPPNASYWATTSYSVRVAMGFYAYASDATNLEFAANVINGSDYEFLVAVAAQNTHTYSNPNIHDSLLTLTNSGVHQNECLLLTTVNAAGSIKNKRIVNNVCKNSGIQTDGEAGVVSGNDISGWQFGAGIFVAYNTGGQVLTGAGWYAPAGGQAAFNTTVPHGLGVGNKIVIVGASPSGYNGTYTTQYGTAGSFIVVNQPTNPGTATVAGTLIVGPSSFNALYSGNNIHDALPTMDVNNTPTTGIEASGQLEVYNGNTISNVGAAGIETYGNNNTLVGNTCRDVGRQGASVSPELADATACISIRDSSSQNGDQYKSNNTNVVSNVVLPGIFGSTLYGYREASNFYGSQSTVKGNSFSFAATRGYVVNSPFTIYDDAIQYSQSALTSAVASLNFNNIRADFYKNWELTCRTIIPASPARIGLRVGTGTTPTFQTTSYSYQSIGSAGGTASNGSTNTETAIWFSPDSADSTQYLPAGFTVRFGDLQWPTSGSNKLFSFKMDYAKTGVVTGATSSGSGYWNAASTAISSIQILAEGVNLNGACTLKGTP